MDRMSPLDASFLHVENAANHMHIGSVGIFEGPAPNYGDFADLVAGKLPLVPRYRQKVHHCMVDGVSGSDLLAVMLDPKREPPGAHVDTWRPEPEPSDVRLVSEAIGDLVVSPYEQFRAMRAAARGWGQLAELFVDAARGVASMAGLVRPNVESSLNGPIGPHRRWDWAHTTLADVKRVRSALGGTVNDVVLAVLTRGFRDLIIARDESPAGRV